MRWLERRGDLLPVAPALSKAMPRGAFGLAGPEHHGHSSSSSPAGRRDAGAAFVIASAVSGDSTHGPQHK